MNSFRNKTELPFTEDAFAGDGGKEIIEEYNEEKEAEWRIEHRRKVKESKLKEAADRNKKRELNDQDILARLEELEALEELEQELNDIETSGDDQLLDIMSGKIELPPPKKRIAHERSGTTLEPKFSTERLESVDRSSISSINSDDDLFSQRSDSPTNFDSEYTELRELQNQIKHLTKLEQLKAYKKKIQELHEYLDTHEPKSIDDLGDVANKESFLDLLVDTVADLREEIQAERYEEVQKKFNAELEKDGGCSSTKLDEDATDPDSQLSKGRRISFASQNSYNYIENREDNIYDNHNSDIANDNILRFLQSQESISSDQEVPAQETDVKAYTLELKYAHSNRVFEPPRERNLEESASIPVIQSPVDIYNQFSHCFPTSRSITNTSIATPLTENISQIPVEPIKSILKNKDAVKQEPHFTTSEELIDDSPNKELPLPQITSIVGDVVEKTVDTPETEDTKSIGASTSQTKSMSLFRRARQKRL